MTGQAWGTQVPAAPAVAPTETWAFVVAGRVDGAVPVGGRLRVTNSRTGEIVVAHISHSRKFTAAFVDLNKHPVVSAGDEITTQLLDLRGVPLTEAKRHRISREHLARAYLMVNLSATPDGTRVLQNYPNPFNPETWIPYQLVSDATVKIDIYDINGALVRQLDLGHRPAGYYVGHARAAYWDGRSETGELVSSGLYFYRFRADDFTAVKRMVLIK